MRELPPGWVAAPLGEIADVQLGKMLSQKSRSGRGSRPYIRNVNVRWGSIATDDLLEMDFDRREEQKYALRVGDVLVCEGGEPGRAAVWTNQLEGALYQKALHRVRFRLGVLNSRLFVYQLEFLARRGVLIPRLTGSTIKHLPREVFVSLPVLVPPLGEQVRILAALDEHLSRLDAAINGLRRIVGPSAERPTALAGQLRQSILHGAFSGHLVPQNPSDESANVLVERVGAKRTHVAPNNGVRVSNSRRR